MEPELVVELVRLLISSAFTLAEIAKLSDEEKHKILLEEIAKVKARNPADLPQPDGGN